MSPAGQAGKLVEPDSVSPLSLREAPVMAVGAASGEGSKMDDQLEEAVDEDEGVMAAKSGSELHKPLRIPCLPVHGEDEAQPHKTMRNPGQLTKQQREDYRCTNWPYWSWCRHCVLGRGQHDQHRKREKED